MSATGEALPLRRATCSCGQLGIALRGEPVRISVCHCVDCQRRTGSVFGVQARFARSQVAEVSGRSATWSRRADSGKAVTFHRCPGCGATVYWELESFPDLVAVAVGAFADPGFPAPRVSVYERRRHAWARMPEGPEVEHLD